MAPKKGTLRKCKNGHSYYKSSDCPVCPICEAKKKPTDDFLSLFAAPARRALESKSITSVKHLTKFTEKEIAALHAMGPSSMKKLKDLLKKAKFSFKK